MSSFFDSNSFAVTHHFHHHHHFENNSSIPLVHLDHSIIDGINSAIVLNKQNESLQTSNVQLNQFKNILQDPDLLNEYIENNYGGFRPAIMQVEHEVTSALQLAPEYSTYITRFGVPENGVFDSQKLELIRLELSNT